MSSDYEVPEEDRTGLDMRVNCLHLFAGSLLAGFGLGFGLVMSLVWVALLANVCPGLLDLLSVVIGR